MGPPPDHATASPTDPPLRSEPGGTDHRGAGYLPHLDGLRAVAVYLVVAFHAGVDHLRGGFIGVDVFFVLSGYLVTRLLLRELYPSSGRRSLRLGRFYARRVRRLLPAAVVNLAVTAVVFRIIAAPAELADAADAMRAAALYVSNWWFVRESADYFGATVGASPVLHYWSLSVEEQYYLVWPLGLLGATVLARRLAGEGGRRALGVVVGLAAVAGAGAALTVAGRDLTRAYYGTDLRAYQLLVGAVPAFLPGIGERLRRAVSARVLQVAAAALLLELVGVATMWFAVAPVIRGVAAATATATLIVVLEAASGGPVHRVLAARPLRWLGQISYGTYLWHWIVVLVVSRELEIGSGAAVVVVAGTSTAIAALSYVALERPIRRNPALDRVPRATVAFGLAISAFVGLVALPLVARTPGTNTLAADDGPVTVDWRSARLDIPDLGDCVPGPRVCPLHSGSGRRVLLVGDSHAAMLLPTVRGVAEREDWELGATITLFCPWVDGIRYYGFSPDCFDQQQAIATDVIPRFDPDLVILVHRSVDDPLDPLVIIDRDRGGLPEPTPQRAAIVAQRVQATVAWLRGQGRDVVVIEPIPALPPTGSVPDCLSRVRSLAQCRTRVARSPLPEEQVLRAADRADDHVWSIDLDRAVCPNLPVCDPVVDGKVVRYDASHLTGSFAATLVDELADAMDRQQVPRR